MRRSVVCHRWICLHFTLQRRDELTETCIYPGSYQYRERHAHRVDVHFPKRHRNSLRIFLKDFLAHFQKQLKRTLTEMGSVIVSETDAVHIVDNILPFLNDEDAVFLSESVLAPKPKPRPKLTRSSPIRFPSLLNPEFITFSMVQ